MYIGYPCFLIVEWVAWEIKGKKSIRQETFELTGPFNFAGFGKLGMQLCLMFSSHTNGCFSFEYSSSGFSERDSVDCACWKHNRTYSYWR